MSLFDKVEAIIVLILALFFWLYIGAGLLALLAGLFGYSTLAVSAAAFLKTAVIYVFVGLIFLLFWPVEDEGPYLS